MPELDQFKHFLSDNSCRIQLYDTVHEYCVEAVDRLNSVAESPPAKLDGDSLPKLLNQLHEATSDLRSAIALLGFWNPCTYSQLAALHSHHFIQWINSTQVSKLREIYRWYPLLLQHYSLGLGAVASSSFELFRAFIESPYPDYRFQHHRIPAILVMDSAISDARQLFQLLPGHEKNHTPLSEYLFDFFKSDLNEVIFLANDFEYVFDKFESLYYLQYSHLNERLNEGRFWSPVGRFGWKFTQRAGPDPLRDLIQDAVNAKQNWPPISAGFFDGDYSRFEEVATSFTERLSRFAWH